MPVDRDDWLLERTVPVLFNGFNKSYSILDVLNVYSCIYYKMFSKHNHSLAES